MSGAVGHVAGGAISTYGKAGSGGTSFEESEERVKSVFNKFESALDLYKDCRGDVERRAHRARVLSDVASDLMNAAFMLQHAAYEKATK